MQQQPGSQLPVPDIYADAFQVTTTPFGVNMTFSLRDPHPSTRQLPGTDLVRVRMSPEHAKIVAMMLVRQIKQYERDAGIKIAIPSSVYTQLGLPCQKRIGGYNMAIAHTLAPDSTSVRLGRRFRPHTVVIDATERPLFTTNLDFGRLQYTSRDPNQMYYWSREWQQAESAARADILAGRATLLIGPEAVEAHFSRLTEQNRSNRRQRGGSQRRRSSSGN